MAPANDEVAPEGAAEWLLSLVRWTVIVDSATGPEEPRGNVAYFGISENRANALVLWPASGVSLLCCFLDVWYMFGDVCCLSAPCAAQNPGYHIAV